MKKNITLEAAIDEAVAKQIKSLQAQVRRLESRLATKDRKINELKEGASFSKERRASLLLAVDMLASELQSEDWIEIDRYY